MSDSEDTNGTTSRIHRGVVHRDAPTHREYVVDGAWGGVNLHNQICMTIYREELRGPQRTHLVIDKGTGALIGEEVDSWQSDEEIIRTSTATLRMTPHVALQVSLWLQKNAHSAITNPRSRAGVVALEVNVAAVQPEIDDADAGNSNGN